MLLVEPPEYRQFEGTNISTQAQVRRRQQTRMPVMSQALESVEGFYAADIEQPVLGPDGQLLGSL